MKYDKYFKVGLRLSIMIALIFVMYCSWGIQRQNIDQIFWSTSRTTNTFGFIFLVVGWAFWEFYATSKTKKMWIPIFGIVFVLCAFVLINGMLGTIFGIIALALIVASFTLDKLNILALPGRKGVK